MPDLAQEEFTLSDLVTELKEHNELLRAQIKLQRNWQLSLRNGILAGLGSFIGATLLAAILLAYKEPVMEAFGLKGITKSGRSATSR